MWFPGILVSIPLYLALASGHAVASGRPARVVGVGWVQVLPQAATENGAMHLDDAETVAMRNVADFDNELKQRLVCRSCCCNM